MNAKKTSVQVVWGWLLILFGAGMFFRIPQVMPRIQEFECFSSGFGLIFAYFSLYLIGVLLIGGGAKKIYDHSLTSDTSADKSDPEKQ
ncbi:MAG: hypothetical protein AB7S75_23105 [Desulfococcaceae bacterium]